MTVAHGSKGIVLDGSVGTVLDGVEVFDIGAEGVHFRTCSSDGVLRNSYIHDTGIKSPQYGEGVYVGSANSNWSKYQCTDATEGKSTGDNSERVLIEHNVFENITAEGADLKEGTDSGTLRDNEFRHAGISGLNDADSAVDAKGDNWLIEGNTVSDTGTSWEHDGANASEQVQRRVPEPLRLQRVREPQRLPRHRSTARSPGSGSASTPSSGTRSRATTSRRTRRRALSATTASRRNV